MVDVVIVSDPKDLHARVVRDELATLGVECAIWQASDLLTRSSVTATLGSHASFQVEGSLRLDLMNVRSIWLRRTHRVAPPPAEPWLEHFLSHESTRALEGLLASLDCFWINPPLSQTAALLKLRQLKSAQRCGFQIPETLVTNCPEAATEFLQQHDGKIIYKLVDERSQQYLLLHRNASGVPTTRVLPDDGTHLESVANCLHVFQSLVEKQYDLRVVVVADSVRAVKINSQEGRGKIDFRLDYSVPITAHTLPEPIERMCKQLVRDLGLVFGCIDLAVDRHGRHIFFEINPQGQFLWMEEHGVKIAPLIASVLASGG